jgi:hypothetical protein
MRLFSSLFIVLFLFSRCNKEEQTLSAEEILTGHTWYPVQSRIVTTDSSTGSYMDINGNWHSNPTVYHKWDTTYMLNQCTRQSVFTFQPGGALQIQNMCNSMPFSSDTGWTLLDERSFKLEEMIDPIGDQYIYRKYQFRLVTPNPDYELIGSGILREINSSDFVVTQPIELRMFYLTYINNLPVDSTVHITGTKTITFKSQ